MSPEELESPYLYMPERDMWHVGLCFLQMLYGRNVLLKHPNLKSIIDDGDYCFTFFKIKRADTKFESGLRAARHSARCAERIAGPSAEEAIDSAPS